jgi:glycyl-tRNA synthetase beta chain
VVRILLDGEIDLDLRATCEVALRNYGETLPAQAGERLPALLAFLEERVRYLLGLKGFAYDEIEAGLRAGWRSLPDLRRRVAALHVSRERPGFVQVVLAAKRIANIVKSTESTPLAPARLAVGAERDLQAAGAALAAGLDADLARGDYEPSLARIADLAGVLDRFFVDVLVMDPDPEVRANRLALLREVGAQLGRVAALTEMVVDKSELKER